MNENEILNWLSSNIIQIIIILSIFVQISPIKWNPISSFVKWFGKLITSNLEPKIKSLTDTVNDIQNQVNENEKDRIRWEILDFANSCRNGRLHTKEEFKHIIDLNDKYKKLLALKDDKNGVFEADYEYINRLYQTRLEKNDFLV